MTYKLEEFKAWIEENETRQRALSWLHVWPQIEQAGAWEKLVSGSYLPLASRAKEFVLEWKQEVDEVSGLDTVGWLRLREQWKTEVKELKAKVGELEQGIYTTMPGSWETESDGEESLVDKIRRKKVELQSALTDGKKSTAPLRKQIELLEKVQSLETRIKDLETKETNYKEQIQQKDLQIQQKQTELTTK